MSDTRARVVEHRLTRSRAVMFWTVRFWVESDPEFGGVTAMEALRLVGHAMSYEVSGHCKTQQELAEFLVEQLPCVNSVEVCDSDGDGVAVHRDWP